MARLHALRSRGFRPALFFAVLSFAVLSLAPLSAGPALGQLLEPLLSLGSRPWTPSCTCMNAPVACSGDTYDPNPGPHEFDLSRVPGWGIPSEQVPVTLDWPAGWSLLGYEVCYGTLVSGDPGRPGTPLLFSFADCPVEDRPFLRVWLDCGTPGTFRVAPDQLQACGGGPQWEELGLWVDIGDFCGHVPRDHCSQCAYRSAQAGSFTPDQLTVTLPPGGAYVDTLEVRGDTGPQCGGLPECGCDGGGACFGGIFSEDHWLFAQALDYQPSSGYRTVHFRLSLSTLGLPAGTYHGRVWAGAGCCCYSNCMPVTLMIAPVSAVSSRQPARTAGIALGPPVPNPTRGMISFSVEPTGPTQARVRVFDAGGRFVAEIFNGALPAGITLRSWSPSQAFTRDLPSGAYFLRLDSSLGRATRMFVLRK